MSWVHLSSISVTTNSKVVTVNSANTSGIKAGDGLQIGTFGLFEVEGVFANQLTLKTVWPHASQQTVAAVIVPTFGDFNTAVEALRAATTTTHGNFEAMERWWTENADIIFKDYQGTEHTVRSAKKMDADVAALEQQLRDTITETDSLIVMTEAQAMAIRRMNMEKYAASDFVYPGKHIENGTNHIAINEGLFTNLTMPNVLLMGRGIDGVGSSPTDAPVLHTAGVVGELRGIFSDSDYNLNILPFPKAERGVRTWDSATGISFDFSKEVDPKYGDVAGTTNEAVSRAFGLVRLDNEEMGEVSEAGAIYDYATQKITHTTATGGVSLLKIPTDRARCSFTLTSDKDISYELRDSVSSGASSVPVLGMIDLVANQTKTVELTLSGRGVDAIYLRAPTPNNAVVTLHSISVIKGEVVASPVHMGALEIFPEETTDEVFPFVIQNKRSDVIPGVPMVLSKRKKSYFQAFDGQFSDPDAVNDEFYRWDWPNLSDEHKCKVAAYMGEKLYMGSNGKLINWRCRWRSFVGMGNGDWDGIGSSTYIRFDNNTRLKPQGRLDSIPRSLAPFSADSTGFYTASADVRGTHSANLVGVNVAHDRANTGLDNNIAHNGECYLLVAVTVPRLNQAGYHQSFNPLGARSWRTRSAQGRSWAHPNVVNSGKPTSASDCFVVTQDTVGTAYSLSGYINGQTTNSDLSGRPDGKLYDAICASGVGGVVDHRLKYGARRGNSAERASVVREEVKNKTYRGREKLVKTRIQQYPSLAPDTAATSAYVADTQGWGIGDKVSVVLNGVVQIADATITAISGNVAVGWDASDGTYNRQNGVKYDLVHTYKTNITVEGGFHVSEVIAPPEKIRATPDLADGWLGYWNKTLADGSKTYADAELSRKNVGSLLINREITDDDGGSWAAATLSLGDTPNAPTATSIISASRVEIWHYTAFAKQTVQSEKLPVRNGEVGLSDVDVLSYHDSAAGWAALLSETTIGRILKSGNGWGDIDYGLSINRITFRGDDGVIAPQDVVEHHPINLVAPQNDSPALKVLFHQIEENGQGNLNIIANELIHDGTDWGDDSTVKAIENGTYPNLKGITCKAVVHKLAKPYEWV